MDRRTFVAVIPALILLGCASPGSDKPAAATGHKFSDAERKLITDYYNARRLTAAKPAQGVKPGDKLMTGSRPSHLPNDLKDRLSHLPEPFTRLVLGADVILLNRDTHDILDVVSQVAY